MKKARLVALSGLALLAAIALSGAWWAYHKVGKTPGELMDYAEVRLQGHSKLEWVALPIISQARVFFDQPAKYVLLQEAFLIPKLPSLTKNAVNWENKLTVDPRGRLLQVGPTHPIKTIGEASRLAKDNDTVDIESGEYYGDVALWMQNKLTIRAKNGPVRIHALNKTAEGKAIWVFRKGDIAIEGIEFVGATAYDKNGAGIRFEEGRLKLINCLFYANETGLLVGDLTQKVEIIGSEFGYSGHGDGRTHNLYVGKIEELRIVESYFHHVNVGHHIKSRAKTNYIYNNRITDEDGGRASFEIDFSNGGQAYVVGNIIQQGTRPQNSTMISYGAEGLVWKLNELYVANNTMVNDVGWGGTFIRVLGPIDNGVIGNNLFSGPGAVQTGHVSLPVINNKHVDWSYFKKPSRYDYSSVEEKCQRVADLSHFFKLEPFQRYRQKAKSPEFSIACIGA